MRGISSGTSVPAPERFDADPEPTFYVDADPDLDPNFTQIGRINLYSKLQLIFQNL